MFEYFDGNYTWNMAVNIALGMGASIGDIDDVSRPLRAVAKNNDDDAAEKFFAAWNGLALKVKSLAAADETKGRRLSAGEKYRRAAIYFIQAERMQGPHFEPRKAAFSEMLGCFAKFVDLTRQPCRRVEVPYAGTSLPALFTPALGATPGAEKTPCMVHFDGLDVTKEILYFLGIPEALAKRGVASLVVDNPGVGESLRLNGLHNSCEAEKPAGAAFDHLAAMQGIDAQKIGIMALSLGGFHAPRVAAFDQRFACCVAWGANYDWGATQRARFENKAKALPVPHYWDHVGWAFGISGAEKVLEVSATLTLRGVLDRIRCPILVVHGENDRQITLDQARQTVDECVNSPKRELHVQTLHDGGAEHCGIDNVAPTREIMADWIAETLVGHSC